MTRTFVARTFSYSLLAALVASPISAQAQSGTRQVTLTHVDRGSINNSGAVAILVGKNFKVPSGSYQVRAGVPFSGGPSVPGTRPYFTFALDQQGPLQGRIVAASFSIFHPDISIHPNDSPDSSESMTLFPVGRYSPDELRTLETPRQPFTSSQLARLDAIFGDLGDGYTYGKLTASRANNTRYQTISLTQNALRDLNVALEKGQTQFTLAGDLTSRNTSTTNPHPPGTLERIFRGSSENSPPTRLILTLDESAEPGPAPAPALGGFGLALLGLGLGGASLARARRR